jgi:hypothetical protein
LLAPDRRDPAQPAQPPVLHPRLVAGSGGHLDALVMAGDGRLVLLLLAADGCVSASLGLSEQVTRMI